MTKPFSRPVLDRAVAPDQHRSGRRHRRSLRSSRAAAPRPKRPCAPRAGARPEPM